MRRGVSTVLFVSLCAAALSCAPRQAGVDRWLSDLHDEHWQVRASAAAELGRRGVTAAIPAVTTALTDDSADVRAAAAGALLRLGARSALPGLRSRIQEDEDPKVVTSALFALGGLARNDDPERRQDIEMLIAKLSDPRRGVDGAAERVLFRLRSRPEIVADIRSGLRSSSVDARVRASWMALALDLPELAGWERDVRNDPSSEVRGNAYEAARDRPGPHGLSVFVAGLHDESPAVRTAAAAGLGDLGDPAAVPALERSAGDDPDAGVRERSAEAIASIMGIPGSAMPARWHFERIADRLALDGDGACELTRTLTLVVDASPEPIRTLKLLVPRAFPQVARVTDAQGRSLSFELERHEGVRQLVLAVPPIERGAPATLTVFARSKRPVFARGAGEAGISYAPGPFQARVQTLHVGFESPAGGAASLDRTGVPPGEAEDVVLRVTVPASGVDLRDAPAGSTTRGRDLTTAAAVVASILGGLAATVLKLRRKLEEEADRAILVAALTTGALLFLTPILLEDNLSYYAWGRSAVLDGNLDRSEEFTEFNQSQAFAPSNREPQDPIFASLSATPFIAAAHALTRAVNAVSPAHAPNGFSFPYLFLTALGDFFAVLLGSLACFSLVTRRVGRRYALFAVLAVVFGTNLLLFAYAWTGSSYQPSFLLFAVFLNHWDKTREARGRADWFAGGLLLGLLAMTRTLNLGFALIPLLDWSHAAVARFRKAGPSGLAKQTGLGALLASGMLVGYAPQLLVQRLVDQTFVLDAYGVGSGRFAGFRDNVGPMLFAVPDGLFAAMPVLALAFVGLVPLFRFDRRLGAVLTATLASQILVIGSYPIYWGRFLYGTPYLVPCTPIFCLAMASLMREAESRWRRFGPAVLRGLAVLLAARNGWCVLMMLARKMVGPSYARMTLGDVVHTLLLPDRMLDVDVLRPASEFGCVLRELVGGFRAWDLGRLFGALGWASLIVLPVLLAYPAAARIRAWHARVPRRAVISVVASALVLGCLATMSWVAALASRTDVDYAYQSEQRHDDARDWVIERLGPGESFSWWFGLGNPSDRFSVITFLDGAADVPQGERVAMVKLVADDVQSRFELLAGVDTADFEVDRPESRAASAHAAPLDRACLSWRVGDDSSRFYTARAYRSVFTPEVPMRPTAMTVTSLLTHGSIDVLVATSRERKLPQDRSRRRFIPVTW